MKMIKNMIAKLFLIVFVFDIIASTAALMEAEMEDTEHEKVLTELQSQLMINYNKNLRPNIGGVPVTVGVSMYVLAVQDVSDKNMEFTMDIYFRQFWVDPRLAFERRPWLDKLVLGEDMIDKIWKPDTFFVNDKPSQYRKPAYASNSLVRILHSGDILLSRKISVTASCPMDFSRFPMDSQLCTLEFESFGYTMSDMRYIWNDGLKSVQMSPDVSYPTFFVLGHRQRIVEASLSSGNYSRLLADVQFVRATGYYVNKYYTPAGILVAVSWLSFLIDHKKPMARLSLCLVPFVSIIILECLALQEVAQVSYRNALDNYLGTCSHLVGVTLLVSVLASALERAVQGKNARPAEGTKSLSAPLKNAFNQLLQVGSGWWFLIDCLCLLIFPLAFLGFHKTYWNSYSEQEVVDDLIKI